MMSGSEFTDLSGLLKRAAPLPPTEITGPVLRESVADRRGTYRWIAPVAAAAAAAAVAAITFAFVHGSSSTAPRTAPGANPLSATTTGPTPLEPGLTWQKLPWASLPIHTTDDPTTMLIDVTQDTDDPSSQCWIHTRTSVDYSSGRFDITLWVGVSPSSRPSGVSCAADSIAGPFYATVDLPVPYDGQSLVDPVSGRVHEAAAQVRLADAPFDLRH